MFRFSLTNLRFLAGQQVTDGVNVGTVRGRSFNSLLKRESTDTFIIVWKRTLTGRFLTLSQTTVSGAKLSAHSSSKLKRR